MSSDWSKIYSRKLIKVKRVFSVDKVLNVPTDPDSIAKYYKVNIIPYSVIYRGNDFIHTALTPPGHPFNKDGDLLAQARMVEEYFDKETKNVLELATGRGANSFYLAKKHPEINFYGLDLPGGHTDFAIKKSKETKNFQVKQGDYHDLSGYPEGFFDLVFIVEALCHSEDKTKVMKEVKRVLKKGGRFIIFDAYTTDEKLTQDEELVKKLVERGMSVPDFPRVSDFRNMIKNAGLEIELEKDLSDMTIPTYKRIEKYAAKFFNFPGVIQKLIVTLFPPGFTYNSISGYFMIDSVESGLSKYLLHVLRKD